jgi:hypothetical protein
MGNNSVESVHILCQNSRQVATTSDSSYALQFALQTKMAAQASFVRHWRDFSFNAHRENISSVYENW